MSSITEAQFNMIIKSALGNIDYEYLLLAVSDYHFRRAKELKAGGMEAAYEREFRKGEKILDHVCTFRKLNEEVSDEIHSFT